MLQAIIRKGKALAEEVPAPMVSEGHVLIKVAYSCISSGTEMSGVEASTTSFLQKGLGSPSHIETLKKIYHRDGLVKLVHLLKQKREEHQQKQTSGRSSGYSVSGIVLETGKGVTGFKPGDRVAAAGMHYASHAEFVVVPKNLVVKVPDGLDLKYASTVTMGGISLQGVRRSELRLGEFAAVVGTGLLGLLTIQLLKGAGVRVAAIEPDPGRLALAKELGAEVGVNPGASDPVEAMMNWSNGHGVDAVIFTATTSNPQALSNSFKMCRKKGRVIMVGVGGNTVTRSDLYAKELDYKLSTSYGPGRYDPVYEEKGQDYPYAYVRWTENRNMTEYLRLIQQQVVNVDKVLSAEFPIEEVDQAFALFDKEGEKPITIVLRYDRELDNTFEKGSQKPEKQPIPRPLVSREKGIVNVSIVGAGGFAGTRHLPNVAKRPDLFRLHSVVDRNGLKAKTMGERYHAGKILTDIHDVFTDSVVDLIIICTRHGNHGHLVLESLKAGKNVFVEKPLAATKEELDAIRDFYLDPSNTNKPLLMVGFNRRFSSYARAIRNQVENRINPIVAYYRMNAGYVDRTSWLHDDGGRIVGEACHIIDLMSYFTGASIETISPVSINPTNDKYLEADNKTFTLKYTDGSICTISYFANGSKELSKEYLELHFDGKSIVMDDYDTIRGYGLKISAKRDEGNPKGHMDEIVAVHEMFFQKGEWPISLDSLLETSYAAIAIKESTF